MELRTSIDELVEGFDITRFGAAPTKFDADDLFPLTAHVLQERAYEQVADTIAALGVPDDIAPRFWEVMRENITTLNDLGDWWALCRDGAEPIVDEADREFVAQGAGDAARGAAG